MGRAVSSEQIDGQTSPSPSPGADSALGPGSSVTLDSVLIVVVLSPEAKLEGV